MRKQRKSSVEDRFRALTDAMVDGVIVIDQEGVIQSFNPSAEHIFGYEAKDVLGRNVALLMPSPYRDEHDGYVQGYLETGQAKIIGIGREVIGRRKDGGTFPMHLAVGEMPEEARRYFVGVVRDLTDEKEVERALQESENRYRQLLEAAPDAIWIALVDQIVYANSAASELFGAKDANDLVGRQVLDFVHPDDRDQVEAQHDDLLCGARAIDTRVRRLRMDGTAIHTETCAIRVEWANKPAVLFIGHDITDQMRVEDQLRQSQRMEAIGQLAGGIAHDFNNLLTVQILDLEDALELATGQEQLHELVEEAHGVALSGAELTHQLLAYSRKQDLKVVEVDIKELISGNLAMLRRTMPENIEIDLVFNSAQLGSVLTDSAQFENALLNLMINARDAMPQGGRITIQMRGVSFDEDDTSIDEDLIPGKFVEISISDTGTGMPSEVAGKAFDPFFTTKDVGTGTGLGLSMVYGFMKQSGGHASIYSEEGLGTTVKLFVPTATSDSGPISPCKRSANEYPTGDETILFVEDFARLRKRGAQMLAELGYSVIEATDGPNALQQLEAASNVDLLFTDVVMPGGIDGFELAARAREMRPGLRVLYTTGYADRFEIERQKIEIEGTRLQKPFSKKELAETIRAALDTPR